MSRFLTFAIAALALSTTAVATSEDRTAAYRPGAPVSRAPPVGRRRKLDMRAIDAMLSGLQKP